jgi:hypothetical protein
LGLETARNFAASGTVNRPSATMVSTSALWGLFSASPIHMGASFVGRNGNYGVVPLS